MLILAVETSCDDSAVALLDGCRVIAESVATQIVVHSSHGGVVPELASRQHLEILPGLVEEVLAEGGLKGIRDLDVLAATAGPGLLGSLLVGLSWTKAAAWSSGTRFLAINHLAAHLHIHYSHEHPVEFPAVALLASGGHTSLFSMSSWEDIQLLGATRDDAAGEAFDKTAKLMGLGFPGGAELDTAAEAGDPTAVRLPAPLPDPALPEFSFSGLKTAARLQWEGGAELHDLSASFRKVIVDVLLSKLLHQANEIGAKSVLAAGGVVSNSLLRSELRRRCSIAGLSLHLPAGSHAVDNAVMVGRAAAAVLDRTPEASSPMNVNAFARWTGSFLEPLCT